MSIFDILPKNFQHLKDYHHHKEDQFTEPLFSGFFFIKTEFHKEFKKKFLQIYPTKLFLCSVINIMLF